MKIFLDTADVPTILKHFETGLIDGITTNPSLIAKNGDDMAKTIKTISYKNVKFTNIML